jgi:hypothetical protein
MLRGRMPNTSIVTCLSWGGLAHSQPRERSSSSARYRTGRLHVIFLGVARQLDPVTV